MAEMSATMTAADEVALGLEVPVSEIDKALRRLWEEDEARTNASLMNLVIYSEKPGSLLENTEIARDMTVEHACRVILVEVATGEPVPTIRSWVTAHCHLVNGRKSVCCEQIAIRLTGKVTGRFRNTVFSHLQSDLPLVLWWQGELSERFSERLVNVIDRLSFDSSQWADPLASYRMVMERTEYNPDLILHDLEWTRSWYLRLSVASMFDHPTMLDALPGIDAVEVEHHAPHRNAALFVLAWLSVQAGWSLADRSFVSPGGMPIAVKIHTKNEGAPLSRLVMRSGEKSAVFTRSEQDLAHWHREMHAPGHEVASVAPADPLAGEALLAQHLARGGKNSLLRKVLPRFLRLLEAW